MASQSELVSLGFAEAADAIGSTVNLAVAAAGANTRTTATLLPATYNLVTTSGASTNSVLLPSATGSPETIVALASGQTTLNIFPASNETIYDAGAGTVNAAVTLAATKVAVFKPCGQVWLMTRGA